VGTPIGARDDTALEDVVGLFVNTLVLRADVSGDPSFRDLLQRVHREAVAVYAHAGLPFERLVEAVLAGRGAAGHPLVQIAFGLHTRDEGDAPAPAGEPSSSPMPPGGGTAKFDLSLVLVEQAGVLTGLFEYRRDVITDEVVAGMARHFERIVHFAVAHPDAPLSDWNLLDSVGARRLNDWGRGETTDAARDLPDF